MLQATAQDTPLWSDIVLGSTEPKKPSASKEEAEESEWRVAGRNEAPKNHKDESDSEDYTTPLDSPAREAPKSYAKPKEIEADPNLRKLHEKAANVKPPNAEPKTPAHVDIPDEAAWSDVAKGPQHLLQLNEEIKTGIVPSHTENVKSPEWHMAGRNEAPQLNPEDDDGLTTKETIAIVKKAAAKPGQEKESQDQSEEVTPLPSENVGSQFEALADLSEAEEQKILASEEIPEKKPVEAQKEHKKSSEQKPQKQNAKAQDSTSKAPLSRAQTLPGQASTQQPKKTQKDAQDDKKVHFAESSKEAHPKPAETSKPKKAQEKDDSRAKSESKSQSKPEEEDKSCIQKPVEMPHASHSKSQQTSNKHEKQVKEESKPKTESKPESKPVEEDKSCIQKPTDMPHATHARQPKQHHAAEKPEKQQQQVSEDSKSATKKRDRDSSFGAEESSKSEPAKHRDAASQSSKSSKNELESSSASSRSDKSKSEQKQPSSGWSTMESYDGSDAKHMMKHRKDDKKELRQLSDDQTNSVFLMFLIWARSTLALPLSMIMEPRRSIWMLPFIMPALFLLPIALMVVVPIFFYLGVVTLKDYVIELRDEQRQARKPRDRSARVE